MSIYKYGKYNIEIIRSKRRGYSLEIKADGRIIARAPFGTMNYQIYEFIDERRDWLEKNYRDIEQVNSQAERAGRFTEAEINELAEKALKYIPERVKHYAPKVGVTYGRITIRNQKTRWGSCSSKGNLNFNCLLMLAPPQVIDSVIVHELCHRKHMDHSRAFYNEVLRVFPDYYKWHQWLDTNGKVLLARTR